nr:MAG TPA: hypothetical protein [Crassvirales sp.]
MDSSGTQFSPGISIPLDTTPAYCLTLNLQLELSVVLVAQSKSICVYSLPTM